MSMFDQKNKKKNSNTPEGMLHKQEKKEKRAKEKALREQMLRDKAAQAFAKRSTPAFC
jgi:hypothetical protein